MSVINQMLQDLDKRNPKQQTQQAEQLQANRAITRQEASNKKWIISIYLLATILIVALAYLLGHYFTLNKPTPKQMTDTHQNPVIYEQKDSSAAIVTTINQQQRSENTGKKASESIAILTEEPRANLETPKTTSNTNNNLKVNQKEQPEIKTVRVLAQAIKTQTLPPLITSEAIILPQTKKHNKNAPKVTKQTLALNKKEQKPQEQAKNTDNKHELTIQRTQLDTPTLIAQHRKKADLALTKRDMNLARKHLNKILILDSSQNETRNELASLYFGSGNIKQAVSVLEQGLVISPQYPKFRLLLARIFQEQNNSAQAYYYLKPLRPEIQSNFDYYAMLGVLAQKNKDSQTAKESYLALVKAQPDKAQWWLGLAIAQDSLGLKEQATISYHQAQVMGQLSNSSRVYIENRLKVLEPNS